MKIPVIKIKQPIGIFYISALSAELLVRITSIQRRQYNPETQQSTGGVQRAISQKRVKEIATYTNDPDATFPTPIIISVDNLPTSNISDTEFEFNENAIIGEIIDGQHRIEGLKISDGLSDFDLPIILMFDLLEEEKAYVFSIINSKQTQVTKSLIYDLFFLAKDRSPQKTAHEIARLLNSDKESPFHRRLKMLGTKANEEASLSQGSFVKYLLPLISKNPDKDYIDLKRGIKLADDQSLPFRFYFINKEDETIYKVLINVFSALRDTFEQEWQNPNEYILSKTTGYGATIQALKRLVKQGRDNKDLTYNFFKSVFDNFKMRLDNDNLKLTSEFFKSNEQEQTRLAKYIIGED